MGTVGNSSRSRLARRLPFAAAPALCGVAAVLALGSATAASASTVSAPAAKAMANHATTARSAAAPRGRHAGPATARLTSATRPTAKHAASAVKYTVKSGDTLSAIAQRFYENPSYWPVIYWANHAQIQYANDIQVGQTLTVPAKPDKVPAAPASLAPAPVQPAPVQTQAESAPVESAPVESAPVESAPVESAPVESAPVQPTATVAAPVSDTAVSTAGDSSFQECVINAESGGDPQVMNSSGHYGLYQFSASTWAAYGGAPSEFGDASVAEQNQVFDNAIAAGGQSNWSAYDGC